MHICTASAVLAMASMHDGCCHNTQHDGANMHDGCCYTVLHV
jgi:hypothetical protein